ncbi:DUF2516 family protein [Corynebacterium phocae]|nr:DUF2516 family protein [Corynebacterium phocae]
MSVNWLYVAVYCLVGLAGALGVITVLSTRSDAFEAAGRQSRTNWALMLAASSAVLVIPVGFDFLAWVGAVVIGVYWFDVRPQLQNIVNGNSSW